MGRWVVSTNNEVPFEYKFVFGKQNSSDVTNWGGDQYGYHYYGSYGNYIRWDREDIPLIEKKIKKLKKTIKEFTGKTYKKWIKNQTEDQWGVWYDKMNEFDVTIKNQIPKEDYMRYKSSDKLMIDFVSLTKDELKDRMTHFPPDKDFNDFYEHIKSCLDELISNKDNSILLKMLGLNLVMSLNLGIDIYETIKKHSNLNVSFEW